MGLHEHVVGVAEWGADLRYTSLVADIFHKHNIFFEHDGTSPPPPDSPIKFNKNVFVEPYSSFVTLHPANLYSLGSFSYSMTQFPSEINIGRYTSIAEGIRIFAFDHPFGWASTSPALYKLSALPSGTLLSFAAANKDFMDGNFIPPVYEREAKPLPIIENDVWIGQHVHMARGITIGTGSIVGAASVVTKNVDPYMIVGGNPARVIRPRFNEKLIERFLASKWWEYDVRIMKMCDFRNPEKFLDDFEALKVKIGLLPYTPEKITFWNILTELAERLQVKLT